MSKPVHKRRNFATLPPLTPQGSSDSPAPAPVPRSDDPTQVTWWKRLVYQERRRHGKIESILERNISTLERALDDARAAYVISHTMRPTANTEKK